MFVVPYFQWWTNTPDVRELMRCRCDECSREGCQRGQQGCRYQALLFGFWEDEPAEECVWDSPPHCLPVSHQRRHPELDALRILAGELVTDNLCIADVRGSGKLTPI